MTPEMSISVPSPLYMPTAFPNASVESQMRNARLTQLATLMVTGDTKATTLYAVMLCK
jgi:hypothetical protein